MKTFQVNQFGGNRNRALKFNKTDVAKGYLILVNPTHPIREDTLGGRLVPVSKGSCSESYPVSKAHSPYHVHNERSLPHPVLLEKQPARMLKEITSVLRSGNKITPVSGFRSHKEQTEIFSTSLKEHGEEFTRKYVAIPGCSEHQTGLAVDLAENRETIDFIRPDFPYTGICGRFRKLAANYGFIERYPASCERITKIAHEPWHFRYVGYPHSLLMQENSFTLEEYTDYLQQYPLDEKHLVFDHERYRFEISYLPVADEKSAEAELPEGIPYQISGNNRDGVIITLWRSK